MKATMIIIGNTLSVFSALTFIALVLFMAAFQDSPNTSTILLWIVFILMLFIGLVVLSIIYSHSQNSWLWAYSPAIVFVLLFLIFWAIGGGFSSKPSLSNQDRQKLAASNGFINDSNHFMCPAYSPTDQSQSFLSIEQGTVYYNDVYTPAAKQTNQRDILAQISNGKIQMSDNESIASYNDCKNSDGKSLGELFISPP